MNYELAKELKDAGFPQKTISVIMGNEDHFIPDPVHLNRYLFVPTLEELIEACRPYFRDLICNVTIKHGDEIIEQGGWVADARLDDLKGEGSTPTEAVARLWLALNKHD